MQESFLLQWAIQVCQSKEEKWAIIPKFVLRIYGENVSCFYSNVKSKYLEGLKYVKSAFWEKVVTTWLNKNEHNQINDLIWNNNHITYQNKMLFFEDWIQANVTTVTDVYINNNFISFDQVCNKVGASPNRFLEYIVVRNAVIHFVNYNDMSNIDKIDFSFPAKFHDQFIYNRRNFRKIIENNKADIKPVSYYVWERKYNININSSHWLIARLCTKEERLRLLQWKILHNIYPTNILLNKMKIKENNLCPFCQETDFIEHFFYSCKQINSIWLKCEGFIYEKINKTIKLSEKDVLFGYKIENTNTETIFINHVILITKMVISKYRYGKQYNIECIFENDIRLRNKYFQI